MTAADPAVSCVVPTHERPGLLREALGSVADQSVVPDEVVVVDDAADPATEQVCHDVAASTGLDVRYVAGDRPGASASRNAGVAAARHDVVALLDDDDLWARDHLGLALDVLLGRGAEPVDAVISWIMLFRDGRVAPGHTPALGVTADEAVVTNPGMTGSNIVVRRAALEAVGGFDEDLMASNDRDLWVRLLRSGASYGVVSERTVYQRTHQVTSRVATSDPRKLVALQRYRDKHAAHLGPAGHRRLREQIARTELRFATTWRARATAAARFAVAGGLARGRMTPATWHEPGPEAPAGVSMVRLDQ